MCSCSDFLFIMSSTGEYIKYKTEEERRNKEGRKKRRNEEENIEEE